MKHIGREVVIKDNAIPSDKCAALISIFEDDKSMIQRLDEEYDGETQYDNIALFNTFNNAAPNLKKFVINLIESSVKEYKELLNINIFLGSQFELPEIMKFRCNQDQFDAHFDANGVDHNRTLTLIWYLNDVVEGGELHIPSKENYIKIKPKEGRLAIVPTDWTLYHYITTPVSSDRYSLITFIRY